MPAVLLTASETLDGAQVTDSLQGGGTGIDFGSPATGSYAPVTNRINNQGALDLYVRHDGATPIEQVKLNIQQYGSGTGFAYGGADSAANDFASLKSMGNVSGSSKNNQDGNSAGLWVDMDANATDSTQFDQANFPSLVKIFGDNNTDGIDVASAFTVAAEAMVYDNGGTETTPSVPVAGKIGAQSAPTVLGDNAHLKFRVYLPSNHGQSGYAQGELVISYVYF